MGKAWLCAVSGVGRSGRGYALFDNNCLLFCFAFALLEPSFDFWVSLSSFLCFFKIFLVPYVFVGSV
ncbi:hypothetical protein DVH24_013646 [Malus domestica]|uniref:Uncharacterized protein n=1 Tax=Malus domestica TaxID=3750 RepID=A0A498JC48_MALDO|nr:hypothetical protein DVH24_013646 [Malus domestica]